MLLSPDKQHYLKLFFHTEKLIILSCLFHAGVGSAYSGNINSEEKEGRGYNVSDVHVDFMMGSDKLCIGAQLPDGSWEPVFTNGH